MEGFVLMGLGLGVVLWDGCLIFFAGRWSSLLHISRCTGPYQATNTLLRHVGEFSGIWGVQWLGGHDVIRQYCV